MVPPARVERAAHGLGIRCSILLSYGGNFASQGGPRFNTIWTVLSMTRPDIQTHFLKTARKPETLGMKHRNGQ